MKKEGSLSASSFKIDTNTVHSYYTCASKDCWNLSTSELERFGKKADRFHHQWITDRELTYCPKTGFNWLTYVEREGMYCIICRRHSAENMQNKNKKFNVEAGVRFKRQALSGHVSSKQHKAAEESELLRRVSVFHAESEKQEVKDTVYFNTFLATGLPKKT